MKVDKYPQIKDDFGWEALEYWANKSKSRTVTKREFSMDELERWSKIGNDENSENEVPGDKGARKYKLCSYTCKKRITMMKHVNTKHEHGHNEPDTFNLMTSS